MVFELWSLSIMKDLTSSLKRILAVPFSMFIMVVSIIPFTDIDRSVSHNIPMGIHGLYRDLQQFSIVNSYGLFRRMTGVGGRPEVVIEMAGADGEFKEVDFLYKPTSLSTPCPWVAPHQPRLDWQMWFAGMHTSVISTIYSQ